MNNNPPLLTNEEFGRIVARQMRVINETLVIKGAEYTRGDRLSNFIKAAHLQGKTLEDALGGMMAKHTVSIFDMIADIEKRGVSHDLTLWEEKINDHIIYLMLLNAVILVKQHERSKLEDKEPKESADGE